MSGSSKQTQTSAVDKGTQAYIEQYRQKAAAGVPYQTGLNGVDAYFNPYQRNVVAGIQAEGDRQAGLANNAAADMATRAGAYGGSREAVLRAQSINDVNRNTQLAVGSALDSGYNNAVSQYLADKQNAANVGFGNLSSMTAGFTPTSQTQTMTQQTPLLPQLIGAGATIGGALINPASAAAKAATFAGGAAQAGGRVAQGGGLNFGSPYSPGFGGAPSYSGGSGINWGSPYSPGFGGNPRGGR